MTQIYSLVFKLSWVLGLLSILAGVVIKLAHLESRVTIAAHTAFIIAGAFFLCALATREMERSQ